MRMVRVSIFGPTPTQRRAVRQSQSRARWYARRRTACGCPDLLPRTGGADRNSLMGSRHTLAVGRHTARIGVRWRMVNYSGPCGARLARQTRVSTA